MGKVERFQPIVKLEAAIEGISYSLTELEEIRDKMDALTGPKFVDLVARLNAQCNGLDKILSPMKDRIKSEAVASGDTVVKGNLYQAMISRVSKTVMDTGKVKEFLGKKLAQFQVQRDEIHISFDVKM